MACIQSLYARLCQLTKLCICSCSRNDGGTPAEPIPRLPAGSRSHPHHVGEWTGYNNCPPPDAFSGRPRVANCTLNTDAVSYTDPAGCNVSRWVDLTGAAIWRIKDDFDDAIKILKFKDLVIAGLGDLKLVWETTFGKNLYSIVPAFMIP